MSGSRHVRPDAAARDRVFGPDGTILKAMHPDLSQLLTPPSAEVEAITRHLAGCVLCRRLVALARPTSPPTEPVPNRLPTVDRGVYGEWRLLHGGGMGRIFGAIDRRLDREVAIKMLPAPEFTAGRVDRAELERRLELEARRSANLDHPGIVAVHEVGRFTDGELFYAMRLIRGEPLDRAIEGRPRLADRLLLVPHVAAAAAAIAFAHSRGVVHRDLKPQNLMIGAFGETQVIDWGLAQAPRSPVADAAPLEDALPGDLTRMGVGTAQYMPPEQAEGAPAHPAMDVYALGATLYHVLAGAPPYGPGDASTVRRRLRDGPPEPLLARSPELPPALVDITEKCMARAPGDRFATALDLARELRRFANGELTRTRRYSATEVLRHWARRHRPELIVAGAGLLALAGLALYGIGRIVEERNVARAASETAQTQATLARAALVQARGSLASRLAALPSRRLEALELATAAVSDALARGQPAPAEAVAGLFDALTVGEPVVPLAPHGAPVAVFGFDGSGRYLVSVADDAEARVFDARSGVLLTRLPDGPRRPTRLVFSRGGRHAFVEGVDVRIGIIDMPAEDPGGRVAAPVAYRFLPPLSSLPAALIDLADGARVAVAALGGEVGLFDVASGRRLGIWRLPDGLVSIEAVGERLFVGALSGSVYVVDLGGGPIRAFRAHAGKVASLMAEPGGRSLLTCSDDDRLLRIPIGADGLPDGPSLPLLRSPGDDCYTVRAASTRDIAAIAMNGVRIWRATEPLNLVRVPLSFEQTSPLPIGAEVFAGVGVSTDAPASCRMLAFSDVEERVRAEVASPAGLRDCAGTPDGRRMAAAEAGATALLLLDGATGFGPGRLARFDAEVLSLGHCGDDVCGVAVDGRWQRWRLADLARTAGGRLPAPVVAVAEEPAPLVVDANGGVHALETSGARPLGTAAGNPVQTVCRTPDHGIHLLARGEAVLALSGGAPSVDRPGTPAPTALACSAAGHFVGFADGRLTTPAGPLDTGLAGPPRRVATGPAGDVFAVTDGVKTTVVLPGRSSTLWDGQALLAAGEGVSAVVVLKVDGGLRVLRADDTPQDLPASPASPTAVALSPDGRRLALGTVDGRTEVFDLANGQTLFRFERPARRATSALLFVPGPSGEHWLLVGQTDGGVEVLPTTVQGGLDAACARISAWGRPDGSPETTSPTCAFARPVPP